jgi:hypothetical protein
MKSKELALIFLAGLGLAALMACSTGDTCDIRTSGISVDYEAIEEGGSTRARAQFNYEGKSLELGNCGDTIEVNGVLLNKVGGVIPLTYEANVDATTDGEFVFSFNREGEGPFTSTTSLPETFAITAPASGDSFSRANAIDITWDNSDGDFMNVVVDADHLGDFDEDPSDTGAYTIGADVLEAFHSDYDDDDIQADLILTRELGGTVDPTFKDATCVGKVIDQISFTSTP